MAAGRHGVYRGNQFRSCESEVKFIGRRCSYHAGGGGEGLGGDRKRRSRIEIDRSKERQVSRRKEVVIDSGHRLASSNSNIERGFDVKTRVFNRIVDQERFDFGSQVENNEGLKSECKVPSPPIKKRKFSPILWDKDENKVSNSSKIDMATERFKLPVFKSTIQSENVIQDSFSVDQFDVLDRSIVTESQVVVVDSSSPQGQIRSSCHEQGELEEEEEEVIVPRNISVTRWAETSCSTRRDNEEIPEPGEIIREGMQAKSTGGKRSDGSVSEGENSDHMLVSNDSVDIDDKNMNDNVNVNVSDRDSKGKSKKNNCPGKNINMLLGCRSVHEFEKLNRINEGTYGVVYRARNKKTKEIVALKKVKMEKETEGFPITSLREINILLCSNHPSIVDLKEVVMDDFDGIFMVMEYMEHDLKGLMDTMKQPFSQSEVKCLMFQLLSAVKYLHDNGVLHRDLKTSNILFNNRGELKICDFGLSRQYGSPLTHMVVTLWYRAPELLLGERKYSTAIDMWSLGCIMAELLAKEPLFNGKTEFDQLDKIFRTLGTPSETIWPGFSKLPGLKGNFAKHQYNQLRKKFPATSFIGSPILSHAGFDLLNRLLTYDPEKRISAEDALNHEWFSEVPLPKSKDFMPTFPPQHAQDSRLTRVTRSPDPLEEQRRRELLQQGTGGIFG